MDAHAWFPVSDELLVVRPRDTRCRDPRLVGTRLAAFALSGDIAPEPDSLVLTAPVGLWRDHGKVRSVVSSLELGWVGRNGAGGDGASVRGWLLGPDRAIGPVLNNLEPSTLGDAAVELVVLAQRAGAEPEHTLAILVQRFVAADASVLARVDPAGQSIRLRACWGVAERLTERLYFDEMLLRGDGLAVVEHRVVAKPTATVAALGGTQVVPVPAELQRAPVFDRDAVRPLAQLCVAVGQRLGVPVELEFAVAGDAHFLLGCEPV